MTNLISNIITTVTSLNPQTQIITDTVCQLPIIAFCVTVCGVYRFAPETGNVVPLFATRPSTCRRPAAPWNGGNPFFANGVALLVSEASSMKLFGMGWHVSETSGIALCDLPARYHAVGTVLVRVSLFGVRCVCAVISFIHKSSMKYCLRARARAPRARRTDSRDRTHGFGACSSHSRDADDRA